MARKILIAYGAHKNKHTCIIIPPNSSYSIEYLIELIYNLIDLRANTVLVQVATQIFVVVNP